MKLFSLISPKKVKPKATSFLPAIMLFIMSFISLILPGSDIPKADFFDLIYFDKWVHIGMFGVLTIAWSYPFLKAGNATKNIFVLITIAVIAYGVAMEFVQKYFAYQRSFDLLDILADTVGAVIAFVWLMLQLNKYKRTGI